MFSNKNCCCYETKEYFYTTFALLNNNYCDSKIILKICVAGVLVFFTYYDNGTVYIRLSVAARASSCASY